jgi:hypothetical protein
MINIKTILSIILLLTVIGLLFCVFRNKDSFMQNEVPNPYQKYKGGNCEFMHNPKTAGIAIKQHIEKNLNKCIHYNDHHDHIYNNNRISIIREPNDRFMSSTRNMLENGPKDVQSHTRECAKVLVDAGSLSKLLGPEYIDKFEELCMTHVTFWPQYEWVNKSKLLCYDNLDKFNDFIKDNCACSTDVELTDHPRGTSSSKDNSYFDDMKLLKRYVKNNYEIDIKKYQETCGK